MSFLKCESVKKYYGQVVGVKNANLTIRKKEIRALLGGNGSGKSTLAKVIGGIINPNSGVIKIDGRPVSFDSPTQAKKQGIIVASQELSLFDNLTVEENIMVCSLSQKYGFAVDRKEIRKKAREALVLLGVDHLMGKYISELSPNHKYLVEFAKTLVQNPKILILDEITSALYKEDVEILKKVLHQLRDEGCTIIFITHRIYEIFDICDSVSIMKNGETIATYDVEDTDRISVLSLMTGISEEEIRKRHEKEEDVKEEAVSQRPVLLRVENMKLDRFMTTIDFTLHKGEFVGVAGLQGHGQSEFIRSLYGLLKPIEIELNSQKTLIKSSRKSAKQGIAFISGDRTGEGIYPERAIAENVLCVSNLVINKDIKKPEEVLDEYYVKYNNNAYQPITSLSGGNQQKVVVARWLCTNPVLLLADDPTKGIDAQARYDMHKAFTRLADQGSAIIMVSSDNEELIQISQLAPYSRVLIMYEGNIVKTLVGNEITVENILAYSFSKEFA